jgi:hypothetical protein
VIYVRQSTLMQVERNTESTLRQYDLASRARQLQVTSSSTFLLNPVELLAVLAVIAAVWLVYERREGFAFAATTVTMASCILSIFVGLYPNVMVSSTNTAYNLTVHNTASGGYSLKVMTVVVIIFLPFVLAYQTWTYYVFRRRISRQEFQPSPRPGTPPGGRHRRSAGRPGKLTERLAAHMGQAIGGILPLAIGVAISVLPIIAIILMLITPRARSNGLAFLAGWLLGLVIVGGAVLVIANAAGVSSSSGPSTAVYAIKLTLGVLFLLLTVKQWRSRPGPGEQAAPPKWMTALDTFGSGKSLGLGAALSGVNPKNLVLTIGAAASIAQTGLPGGQQVGVLAVFIVLASVTVAAPLVVYLAMGAKASGLLDGWRTWLAGNNAAIMMVLFVVFGALLVGQGIAGLS